MEEKKTFKEWSGQKKEAAKIKVQNVIEWCGEHKEAIIVFGPAMIGGIVEIAKISTKRRTVKDEKALKDRYIYDHSSGHYYEMKRKPKNSELVQIDQRKKNGEMLGMILNDMKLLK